MQSFLKTIAKGKESTEWRKTELKKLQERCLPAWTDRFRVIDLSLKKAARVLTERLASARDADSNTIRPLQDLLRRSQMLEAKELYEQISTFAIDLIEKSDVSNETKGLLDLLFLKDAVLLLELADRIEVPANHQRVWQAVNRVLLQDDHTDTTIPTTDNLNDPVHLDMFGESYQAGEEKMPERRLPRLGNVKLRSHSDSLPCQRRYTLIESSSCPVSAESRASLAAALQWLTDPAREDITWSDISNACGFDFPALLLAYPENLPSEPPALASFIARPKGAENLYKSNRFELTTEPVVKALQGLVNANPRTKINIFVLAKADTARTKLLLSKQFAVDHLLVSAKEWKRAIRNIPLIFIRQFAEGQQGVAQWASPDDPFPSDVSRCLNLLWIRQGTRSEQIRVFDIGSALTLLLETGALLGSTAERALRLALMQWTRLLLACAQANAATMVHPTSLQEQRLLPSILGLLLAKLGYWKEHYMKDNAYWIGRLLSLADRLHRNYCVRERKNELPPQLIGNALMPTCLDNPQAGLARLAERLPLYQRTADEKLRMEVAEITDKIDHVNLPDRNTDADKAQLLLGYLARPDLLQVPEEAPQPPTGEDS